MEIARPEARLLDARPAGSVRSGLFGSKASELGARCERPDRELA